MKKVKPIIVIRHETLRECFMEFLDEDVLDDEELKLAYWHGTDGIRSYRQNVYKWLHNCVLKCWGWADYKAKTVHFWVADDCEPAELIRLLAHEVAHLRKPRPKDKILEERKARNTGLDAGFAYEVAMQTIGKQYKEEMSTITIS